MLRSTRWLSPLAAVAAAVGVLVVHAQVWVPERRELGEAFVPRPEVAHLSAFGFRTALADYYWLRAVQVVGTVPVPEQHGTLLGRYIDVVTTLDPWVDHPYRFAALWMTGSERDVREANRLLRRSFAYHPDEWRNRFFLGFNHYYHLEDPQAASRWIEEASQIEGSPAYLQALAARLRAQRAGLDVAETMLREMRRNTRDEERLARIDRALDEIRTERLARVLDRARERFRVAAGRDLVRVEELWDGPHAVLARPVPEPHGAAWTLDASSGEIVSAHVGRRYRPSYDSDEGARRRGWRVGSPGLEEERSS